MVFVLQRWGARGSVWGPHVRGAWAYPARSRTAVGGQAETLPGTAQLFGGSRHLPRTTRGPAAEPACSSRTGEACGRASGASLVAAEGWSLWGGPRARAR